jgi:predicted Zn finger-like uncharacterized protein
MLLTICPSCAVKFRVQPEQLNVRQGRVMCGRCRHVFNAFESLKRIEDRDDAAQDDATGLDLSATPAPNDLPEPSQPRESVDAPDDVPKHDVEFGDGPQAPADNVQDESASTIPAQQASALMAELDTPLAISSFPVEAPPAFLSADPAPADPPEIVQPDEKPLAKNPLLRPAPPYRRAPVRAVWIMGVLVLVLIISAQLVFYFRASIVESHPEARPYLAKACEIAGCSISWGRDEGSIKIEASDLIESPARPGRIVLTATMVNRGKKKQELPAIELRITDNGNQLLTSRILQPRDYLGRPPLQGEGIAPNAELFVNMNLEIANKSPASGYGLRAFYP